MTNCRVFDPLWFSHSSDLALLTLDLIEGTPQHHHPITQQHLIYNLWQTVGEQSQRLLNAADHTRPLENLKRLLREKKSFLIQSRSLFSLALVKLSSFN